MRIPRYGWLRLDKEKNVRIPRWMAKIGYFKCTRIIMGNGENTHFEVNSNDWRDYEGP